MPLQLTKFPDRPGLHHGSLSQAIPVAPASERGLGWAVHGDREKGSAGVRAGDLLEGQGSPHGLTSKTWPRPAYLPVSFLCLLTSAPRRVLQIHVPSSKFPVPSASSPGPCLHDASDVIYARDGADVRLPCIQTATVDQALYHPERSQCSTENRREPARAGYDALGCGTSL